jgi:hypothetical protein
MPPWSDGRHNMFDRQRLQCNCAVLRGSAGWVPLVREKQQSGRAARSRNVSLAGRRAHQLPGAAPTGTRRRDRQARGPPPRGCGTRWQSRTGSFLLTLHVRRCRSSEPEHRPSVPARSDRPWSLALGAARIARPAAIRRRRARRAADRRAPRRQIARARSRAPQRSRRQRVRQAPRPAWAGRVAAISTRAAAGSR